MAETALTVYSATDSGTTIAWANADTSNDNSIVHTDDVILIAYNAGASSSTVTIVTPKTERSLAVADREITVTAGQLKVIGPFNSELYKDSDGLVTFAAGGAGAADLDYIAIKP